MGYRIYLKYLYSLLFTLYFFSTSSDLLSVNYVCKIAGRVANSADIGQTPRPAASDLGLHCLLRPVCPNAWSKYGNLNNSNPLRDHPGPDNKGHIFFKIAQLHISV